MGCRQLADPVAPNGADDFKGAQDYKYGHSSG